MIDLTKLIKMNDHDLEEMMIMRLSEEIIRRRFSLEDYEVLLQDLEIRWPCSNMIGLYDSRARKKKGGWIAICGFEFGEAPEHSETAPDLFRGNRMKPAIFFFQKKNEVINYYHNLRNIPNCIHYTCKEFWNNYDRLDQESLYNFYLKRHEIFCGVVQWTIAPTYDSQFYHLITTENNTPGTDPSYFDLNKIYTWTLKDGTSSEPVKPQEAGKILMFALKWTREIWREKTC